MMAGPTRRRALRILASATACALAPRAFAQSHQWRGTALGADVSVIFSSTTATEAESAMLSVLAEVERLEAIFSLQRGDSELARLNAAGWLEAPSPDLLHVLSLARRAHSVTQGRFDPSVQPIWRFHIDWYAKDRSRETPPAADIEMLRARVGLARVRIAAMRIDLPPGGALTLNGIAQGYITDRASDILRTAGYRHVLVDLGETRALDHPAASDAWRIALPDGRRILLADGAIATSSGAATQFADNGDHHIFDPSTGRPARFWQWISIAHPSATLADALSTGLSCLPASEALQAIRLVDDARLWGETASGEAIQS